MIKIQDQVVVITGAAGGIGKALAEGFLAQGYNVVGIDLNRPTALSKGIAFLSVNLQDAEAIQSAFQNIQETYGAIHILVNNAAVAHFSKPIQDIQIAELDEILSVNLRGAFLCAKAFITANEGQAFGRIINIASTRWHQNEAHWEAYGATKGGLVSLTNSLAVSLSSLPITVNCISPGWIQSADYEGLTKKDHAQHPSGRVGKPSDILKACLYFADQDNDFVNGAHLVIDGGMTKKMIYE